VIIYRYGINSKSDIDVRYYRFMPCWTCWCDVYPQPVWLVVREIEIDNHSIAHVSKKTEFTGPWPALHYRISLFVQAFLG
jgi:hypothetical protein